MDQNVPQENALKPFSLKETQNISAPAEKVKKPRKLTNLQQIIIKHVSGSNDKASKIDWGKEGRICSQLIKKYGADFLLWVNPIEGHKIPSLTFFYSVLGKNYLSDQLVEYSKLKEVKEPSAPEMSSEKIGEDRFFIFKPKTLKDFIKYGKEIREYRTTGR